jgi:flagellar hook-basal body complex protein FliE
MITPIPPTAPGSIPGVGPSTRTTGPTTGQGFGESLSRLVGSVEQSSAAANVAVENMLTGTGDVHEAMIALQRAETALQLTVQVRNKLVQAYQDIMRMPV